MVLSRNSVNPPPIVCCERGWGEQKTILADQQEAHLHPDDQQGKTEIRE